MADSTEARIARIERSCGASVEEAKWLIAELRAALAREVTASQLGEAIFEMAMDRANAAEADNTRLCRALEFYADENRWKANTYGIYSAHDDKGTRARAALTPSPRETDK